MAYSDKDYENMSRTLMDHGYGVYIEADVFARCFGLLTRLMRGQPPGSIDEISALRASLSHGKPLRPRPVKPVDLDDTNKM